MTIPNQLTIFRIILVPVMVLFYYIDFFNGAMLGSVSLQFISLAVIFLIASLTDFFDGYLARKWNQVTTFGKFMDPLADKVIVVTAMTLLVDAGILPAWMLIVVITREFTVSGIRLVAAAEGKVIAASNLGKYKTASTMVALLMVLAHPDNVVGMYVMYIAIFLTLLSGFDYLKKNINIILASK